MRERLTAELLEHMQTVGDQALAAVQSRTAGFRTELRTEPAAFPPAQSASDKSCPCLTTALLAYLKEWTKASCPLELPVNFLWQGRVEIGGHHRLPITQAKRPPSFSAC